MRGHCLLFLLGLLCGATFAAAAPASRPNILFILTDDQGWTSLGCYGNTLVPTPHLDRLAREGIRFTDAYVAPQCTPTRAMLLTGQHTARNRLWHVIPWYGFPWALVREPEFAEQLPRETFTLAKGLRAAGYATGIAGKWHLTTGADGDYVKLNAAAAHHYGFDFAAPPGPGSQNEGDKHVAYLTDQTLGFIERNKDRPFFFYLAHNMPHVPLFVSDKFKGKSGAGLYGDVIQEIDWSVGQVFAALQKHQLDDHTLVVFTSDNGPWLSYGTHAGSAGPLREGKGTSWEGGTRVPCLMRWPGKLPAGTTSDAMLMTIDLLPTFAQLIGAKLPAHKIDGLDVWPLLAGTPGAKNPHESYWSYYAQNELQAVFSPDGKWKLQLPHGFRTLAGRPGGKDGIPARYEGAKIEQPQLYDLQADLGEKTDVASSHPTVVQQLLAHAEKARAELGDSLTQRKGNGVREVGRLPDAK